jgi:hypothetical protein
MGFLSWSSDFSSDAAEIALRAQQLVSREGLSIEGSSTILPILAYLVDTLAYIELNSLPSLVEKDLASLEGVNRPVKTKLDCCC